MRTRFVLAAAIGTALTLATAALAEEGKAGLDGIKKAVGAAKVTLGQAIETAQKEVAAGKVIEAGLETEDGATFFEVDVLSGDAVKEVKVDAVTRKVLSVKDEKPEAGEAEELAGAKKALDAAKLTFPQAVQAAIKAVKDGKAFKIELEMKDGKPVFEVVLLQGDKAVKATLDAVTGTVTGTADWQPKTGEKDEEHEGKD